MPDIMASYQVLRRQTHPFDTDHRKRAKQRTDANINHHIFHSITRSDDKNKKQ